MLSIYDFKEQKMLAAPDFWRLTTGFDSFKGVSFVGSFAVIEKELLPRFSQVDLVLGLEDRKTGQQMERSTTSRAGSRSSPPPVPPFLTGLPTGPSASSLPSRTSFTASTSSSRPARSLPSLPVR